MFDFVLNGVSLILVGGSDVNITQYVSIEVIRCRIVQLITFSPGDIRGKRKLVFHTRLTLMYTGTFIYIHTYLHRCNTPVEKTGSFRDKILGKACHVCNVNKLITCRKSCLNIGLHLFYGVDKWFWWLNVIII